MKATFDTNILIDYLEDRDEAEKVIASCSERYLSFIALIEVRTGIKTQAEEEALKILLSGFKIIFIDEAIIAETINIRKTLRLKVPDAIIYATAKVNNCPLITRNTKDFGTGADDIIVPYNW